MRSPLSQSTRRSAVALVGHALVSSAAEMGADALAAGSVQCVAQWSRTCRRNRTTVVVAAAHLGCCSHEVASARAGLVTHRLFATSEPQPLTPARCSNSGGPPESVLCSLLWRSASRCKPTCCTSHRCFAPTSCASKSPTRRSPPLAARWPSRPTTWPTSPPASRASPDERRQAARCRSGIGEASVG